MIQILSGQTTSANVQATATIDQNTYTAKPIGSLGNAINISYVKNLIPGEGTFVSASGSHAIGWNIIVYLAVNSSNVITSTANQVATAIANNNVSATLVTTVTSGGGTNVQTVIAPTAFTGGVTGVYQRNGNTLIGLQFLTGFTGTTITFLGSVDGVNYGTVYDDTGAALTITIASYVQYMIVSFLAAIYAIIGKLPFVKFVAGSTQSGNVSIQPVVGSL